MPDSFANPGAHPVRNSWKVSPLVSRPRMLRIAALASRVVASTPVVLPLSSPDAPSRAIRSDDAQHKAEDLLLRFHCHQLAGGRKGGMTGAALGESNSRKGADTERIGGPPGDATLGIEAREIAEQEGAPRRSPKVDHFCSDKVDHVENTHCHGARHGERWFIPSAAGS
jgi:hypothetical protein